MSYKKIFEDLQDNFTNNPEEAITSFSVSSRLINGLKTENKIIKIDNNNLNILFLFKGDEGIFIKFKFS